jgi:hypothetical protein
MENQVTLAQAEEQVVATETQMLDIEEIALREELSDGICLCRTWF